MNYGYDSSMRGWRESQKDQLAADLAEFVSKFADQHGMHPYVEVDRLYPGVRIRRITHLSDEQREELVKGADAIFSRIMPPPKTETLG